MKISLKFTNDLTYDRPDSFEILKIKIILQNERDLLKH